LGNEKSLEEERISSGKFFTKPAILKWEKNNKIKEYKIPEVLLSGNHKKIEEWKKENS
jgi:tRNA (guanine-N1)-methyltransferase